ncbi:MAG: hypothetical protein KIG28_06550 [Bacteroidales bacterium]|nr:hypothetical protein [Bacteroidales bacterium]
MRFVAGRGAVAERHREDTAGRERRDRAVAGRGAVAERHREDVAGRSSLREDNAAASGSSCGGLPFKVALVVFCPLFGKKAPSGDELWG